MKRKNIGYVLLLAGMLFGFTAAGSAHAADTDFCRACHGVPDNEVAPNLAGMSAKYIALSLKRFKEGKQRPCDLGMCDIAAGFEEEDMDDLGRQFAEEPFVPAEQEFDATLVARGKKIHYRYCEKCHTENGSKASDHRGILAGQKMGYLRNQLDFVLSGERIVHKKMKTVLEAISKDDIEAVIHYYGSFQ